MNMIRYHFSTFTQNCRVKKCECVRRVREDRWSRDRGAHTCFWRKAGGAARRSDKTANDRALECCSRIISIISIHLASSAAAAPAPHYFVKTPSENQYALSAERTQCSSSTRFLFPVCHFDTGCVRALYYLFPRTGERAGVLPQVALKQQRICARHLMISKSVCQLK